MKVKYKELVEKLAKEHHWEERLSDLFPILESFDKRNDLFDILQGDVKNANDAARLQPTDQYLRRTVIRTSFALIEGLLNLLNQTVLDVAQGGFIQLTPVEIEKLNETRTKNGEIRPDFMPMNKKINFSFEIFARKLGEFEYSIDTKTSEWRQFQKATLVRNRLMHPRKLEDIILDENEMSWVLGATTWFITLYSDLQRQVGDATAKRTMENLIKARIKSIQSGK